MIDPALLPILRTLEPLASLVRDAAAGDEESLAVVTDRLLEILPSWPPVPPVLMRNLAHEGEATGGNSGGGSEEQTGEQTQAHCHTGRHPEDEGSEADMIPNPELLQALLEEAGTHGAWVLFLDPVHSQGAYRCGAGGWSTAGRGHRA